jgi:hypothetical protein
MAIDLLRWFSIGSIPLSAETEKRLEAVFRGANRKKAAQSLRYLGKRIAGWEMWAPKTPQGLESIRFAVLKLSNGKLGDLEYWIHRAYRDWREVLGPAGFLRHPGAHKDWFPNDCREIQEADPDGPVE